MMSETIHPLYGTAARDVGRAIREQADRATVARARRLLAEAEAVDMGDPAVEMLLERADG